MCGLAGFIGVSSDVKTKLALIFGLGTGIDMRGGHAAGYVATGGTVGERAVRLAKRIGTYGGSHMRFLYGAAAGDTVLMHTRFATCGARDDIRNAHPFTVRRDNKAVLHGAHNGVLTGTWTTSRKYNRDHTVDSRELLELIADGKLDDIQSLDGYGVVTWVIPGEPGINMVRLSSQSDMVVCRVKGGGIAYASTWQILIDGLRDAKLKCAGLLATPTIGTVYKLTANGVELTDRSGIRTAEEPDYLGWGTSYGHGRKRVSYYDYGDYERPVTTWYPQAKATLVPTSRSAMYAGYTAEDREADTLAANRERAAEFAAWSKREDERWAEKRAKYEAERKERYARESRERSERMKALGFEGPDLFTDKQGGEWRKQPDGAWKRTGVVRAATILPPATARADDSEPESLAAMVAVCEAAATHGYDGEEVTGWSGYPEPKVGRERTEEEVLAEEWDNLLKNGTYQDLDKVGE